MWGGIGKIMSATWHRAHVAHNNKCIHAANSWVAADIKLLIAQSISHQKISCVTHNICISCSAPASNGPNDEGGSDDGKHELVDEEEGQGYGGGECCGWGSPHVVHQAIGGWVAKEAGVDVVTKGQREPEREVWEI